MRMSLHRGKRVRIGDRKVLNSRRKHAAQCGFSLIELIIVISIMAVLVGLLAPQFMKQIQKKRCETCAHNREAILRIYERAVYDNSMPIYLKEGSTDATGDGIKRVVDNYYSDSTDNMYGIRNEIAQYMTCPVKTSNTSPYKGYIHADTGTAYIVCEECESLAAAGNDYAKAEVSDDMVGWSDFEVSPAVDPTRETPTSEEPTTTESEEFEVSYDLNGHGKLPSGFANPQKVKKGEYAPEPDFDTVDKSAPTYTFGGWFTEADCINQYIFTTPVTAKVKLYAKWTGFNSGHVWPYADDPTWWDPDLFNHQGEVTNYSINGTYNNKYIVLKAPSGIFTSRLGSQFVYVHENNDQKIYMHQAMTPEYYSALKPQWLIHLTGNKTTIDISSYGNNSSVNVRLMTNGDLVEFVDGDKTYLYVYWHDQGTSVNINVGNIRSYTNHPSNMYRVNP